MVCESYFGLSGYFYRRINYMRKKKLKCPVCNFARLIDAYADVETELVAEKDIKSGWVPDYFQKCSCCKNQIGIKKIL